ncbi:MAG: TPM domain-containing protein [Candidatus Hydrogenedentota bacterium]|nr:MAG: TPM domain-containing protein [Candidatus Hydrogenedentota bacterium]
MRKRKLLVLFFIISSFLYSFSVMDIENPRKRYAWVTADTSVLSLNTQRKLNQMLDNLEKKTGIEFSVVAKQNIPVNNLKEFAYELFNTWKIGKADKNNGLLFIMAVKQRKWAFETGYGLEAVLPDSLQGSIAREKMIPYFKQGNYDKGIYEGVETIVQKLLSVDQSLIGAEAPEQEGKPDQPLERLLPFERFPIFFYLSCLIYLSIWFVVFLALKKPNSVEKYYKIKMLFELLLLWGFQVVLFFFPVVIFIFFLVTMGVTAAYSFYIIKRWDHFHESPENLSKHKAGIGKFILVLLLYAGYFSFELNSFWGFISLLVWATQFIPFARISKNIRYGKHPCEHCGSAMRLLTEEEEDTFLSDGQEKEEQIHSVEYDVWFCEKCENIRLEQYIQSGNASKCPKCNFITYILVQDKVLKAPTYSSSGKGVLIFKCQNCNYEYKSYYTIPKKSSSSSSSGGGFSSGGGSFSSGGGSFGGGSSGGGGASGGW